MVEMSFLTRGTEGLQMYSYPDCKTVDSVFNTDNRCSTVCMSKNGDLIAACNGYETIIYNVVTNTKVLSLPLPRTMMIVLSPQNTHIVTWRQYIVTEEIPENTPNVEIWSIVEPQEKPVFSFVKRGQHQWQPVWTDDEKICARLCNAEIQFFEDNNFSKVASRLQRDKVGGVFIPPGTAAEHGNVPHHVALYVPSIKGAHAFIQLYQYGSFEKAAAIAHRSFLKVDTVEMRFNKTGNYGVIIAANEVDKSGTSYYGQTLLYFISTCGESNQIVLTKNGPVYSVEWNPVKDEFIVLYGFMPCRATIFNSKCDSIHEFGDNHYNEILFNPQGNMVGLCGFGNLRGKMKFYDVESRKLLSDFIASDTTHFEWAPSGDIYMTGTLSPRLRQDNEFKIWDVSGKLLHEYRVPDETQLWQLKWFNSPTLLPIPAVPRAATSKEIAASKPSAYRPPSSRTGPAAAPRSLIDHGGSLPNVNTRGVYKPGGFNNQQQNAPSKNAVKNQKKRENRSAQKETSTETKVEELQKTVVDENEKKLKNLKKKLYQVQKLKDQQAAGKALEKNQLEKISTEKELVAEIKKLEI